MPALDVLVLPKAELHVHIEGTLEPGLIFELGERNAMAPKVPPRKAHEFANLQSFLDLYYASMSVLQHEQDFYDVAMAYLRKAAAQGVRHAEIFFDPQAHASRSVAFAVVAEGLRAALKQAEKDLGITSHLIVCFLRDLSEESAMQTLEVVLKNREGIVAVGLDSTEVGNPPSKFAHVFERARAEGFKTVAHAGEEGPPSYIAGALDSLGVSRIDHGVRCMEDPSLVDRLRRDRIPLTVCPLSNVRLKVVPELRAHPLKRMLEAGLVATINSDDPAYFGGYVGENFAASRQALALSDADVTTLAKNSFEAAFLSSEERRRLLNELEVVTRG